MGRPYHRLIKVDSLLYSPKADERLRAARAQAASRRGRKAADERLEGLGWPPYSPGAINAWLLLVSTKQPKWADNLVMWRDAPLTLGEPHEGFFYPDPLGFWTEVRRWCLQIFRRQEPTWGPPEALSLTSLLHMGEEPARYHRAVQALEPRTILFLDEPAWDLAGIDVVKKELHYIADPHRPGKVYEGFWGRTVDGLAVGKSPQHPATHNLYRAEDMLDFVGAVPLPEGV